MFPFRSDLRYTGPMSTALAIPASTPIALSDLPRPVQLKVVGAAGAGFPSPGVSSGWGRNDTLS